MMIVMMIIIIIIYSSSSYYYYYYSVSMDFVNRAKYPSSPFCRTNFIMNYDYSVFMNI